MQTDSFSAQDNDPNVIEISLVDLVRTVWDSRWTVLTVTVLVAICGVASDFYLATYKSEGFFRLGETYPSRSYNASTKISKGASYYIQNKAQKKESEVGHGIPFSDYKRFSALFTTGERFAEYVRDKKLESAPGVEDLRIAFLTPARIAKLIEPAKDNGDNVIGLRISSESADPKTAQQMVDFLGHYIIDSIVYSIYSDMLRLRESELLDKPFQLDMGIMESKEKLEEYRHKGADLKQVLSRYSNLANQQAQQGVPVIGDVALPRLPGAQLVTVEVVSQLVTTELQILEANELVLKMEREQQQTGLFREYYQEAKKMLESTKSGETVLRGLESVKDRVFKDKSLDDEVVKEVYNTITLDNHRAMDVYSERNFFMTSPTLPLKPSSHLVRALGSSLVLGLCLSMVLVFGRNWWRENRVKIYG